MRKRRVKVCVKAAFVLLGAVLLTGGCSGYQSSDELRKNVENVQTEKVNDSEKVAEDASGSEKIPDNSADGEKGEAFGENASEPTAQIIQSETERTAAPAPETTAVANVTADGQVTLNSSWKYADYAKINSGAAVLYRTTASEKKNKVIAVNAGHGTKGGTSVKTQCHPDGTPKVTGGTTGAGAACAIAVSTGMTFSDGTPESKVTLAMANVLKDKLLTAGYDVLMIRDGEDVQLDNIARSVIANNAADCHIAIHWDSTTSNKGAFYMSVPDVASYKNMEPVKSHWQQHNALGASLVEGLKSAGVKIFSGGSMAMDLTQTSYSTIPSVDIELGDKASDHSQATLNQLGDGLVAGVKAYFEQ